MKKIISIILTSIMLVSCLSLAISAKGLVYDETSVEGKKIACVDFLDFSEANNDWAINDNGTWVLNDDADNQFDEENDWAPSAAFVSQSKKFGYPYYTKDKLSWSLTDNGEVLHLEATSGSSVPGMTFVLDEDHESIVLGTEDKGQMEYCKIRIRNYSSADQFTLGYMTSNINNGQSFFTQTVTDVPVESNSGKWVTYLFSVPEYNAATNYEDSLPKNADGAPTSRWSAKLSNILVFPFGYNVKDGSGAYSGASVDIDYIVFGTKEYVTSYKSELEKKEEAVSTITIKTEPTKKTYYVGDAIDLEGLVLEAKYKDGTTETLNSANVAYSFDNPSDKATVTLNYGSASASYTVKVVGLTGIELSEPLETTTYDKVSINDGFSPEGLKIKVGHADGTEAIVGLNSVKLEYDFSELGERTVVVNYHGETCTFNVNIINVTSIKVDDIEGVRYGDEIKEGNLKITCVYSDGTEKSLSEAKISATVEITCDTKTKGTVDMQVKVSNVTYEIDCTAVAKATIEAPSALVLNTEFVAKEYDVDDSLNTEGLVVSYKYADDKLITLDENDYRIRYDFSSPGTKTVTVVDKINDLSATFDVEVKGETPQQTTKTPETTKKPSSGNDGQSSPLVVIIIIVAVVVAAVVVVVIIVVGKKKKSSK